MSQEERTQIEDVDGETYEISREDIEEAFENTDPPFDRGDTRGVYHDDDVKGVKDVFENVDGIPDTVADKHSDKLESHLKDLGFKVGRKEEIEPDEETNLNRDRKDAYENIARQLESKKQVVFYGPPGTGKTYTAQNFAEWWISENSDGGVKNKMRTVTFHPSFSYEDFVEGITITTTEDGQAKYEPDEGVFKEFAKRAKSAYLDADEDGEATPYVLIIDEINRGNLSQIFGENITLLEKDKRLGSENETQTELPHSGEFGVPPNLYIIGTMNTANQSIALVDTALRRRFRFLQYPPDTQALIEYPEYDFDDREDLRDRVESGGEDGLLALSILAVEKLNERILDEANDLNKGQQIGHTYLMLEEDYDTQDVVDVWKYDILPLLEEYYFGQFDRMSRDLFKGAEGEIMRDERIIDFGSAQLTDFLAEIVSDIESTSVTFDNEKTDGGSSGSQRSDLGEYNRLVAEDVYESLGDTFQADSVEEMENSNTGLRSGVSVQFNSQHPEIPEDHSICMLRTTPAHSKIWVRFSNMDTGILKQVEERFDDFPPEDYAYNPDASWTGALNKKYEIDAEPEELEEMDREDLYEYLKEEGPLKEAIDELVRMSKDIHSKLVEMDLEE